VPKTLAVSIKSKQVFYGSKLLIQESDEKFIAYIIKENDCCTQTV
jgi:hypothetical protein